MKLKRRSRKKLFYIGIDIELMTLKMTVNDLLLPSGDSSGDSFRDKNLVPAGTKWLDQQLFERL